MNQMQEYLHDANRRLLCEYSEAKLHLLYLQTAPAALENAEELNALCNEVVLKYKAPPVCEDYSDQASLLANNDLLEVNTELQNLNNAMSQDIAMLEKKFNEVFSQNPQKKSQSSASLSNIGEAADLETAPGHAWEEWKEQCTLLNRQMCEARDRADFLKEQLSLTRWMNDFYKTVIDEIMEDSDTLSGRKNILKDRLKSSRSKLCRCFYRLFCPRTRWYKDDVSFLLRKKSEITTKALDLGEQLQFARQFLSIHEDLEKGLSLEINQLEERLTGLKGWLRDGNAFLFRKQECEVKGRLKGLRKKLADAHDSKNSYNSVFMEFSRIVGKNLKLEFYESIDRHSPRLLEIFGSKRGNVGQLLTQISQQTRVGPYTLYYRSNCDPDKGAQRGKHRRQNTIKRLEQEEWKEQCTLLNRQMCEARDRADFLKEQLSLTRWMNDFYKTVIDEIMEDSDTLSGRKNILKDRLKSSRSKLCRCFYRLFCPRTRWYKDDVSFLLRKKSEITTKALDLGEQLQFARQFLSIHEDLEKGLSLEINQLEERLTGLKGWLRDGNAFLFEELQEQKEVLQEKVKTLVADAECDPRQPKLQRGKHRRQNTIKRLEQEEWKEQCTLLNRQMCEARDRADFLKEQLSLTRWMNDFYKTVIDEIMEDSDTLSGRKNILKDRLKSSRSKLCRCFYRLFCPRTRWYKDDVSFLLRKKSEITTKALDLGEQLQFARQFLSIHEDLEKGLSLEINQLEERLTGLKGWLRDGNAFLFGRKNKKEEDDRILRKQECEVKGRLKGLRKKLADAHDSKTSYNSVIARIEQEQEKINKKMRKIEEKLLKC
ncbi:unnamed protein product [Tetraodon nigroviridis]|uniref:(spotted green pufferfish) hypothetical protein n=1 Tax=Tetraodon nigroviridis TaxID=99883 RepID=Q4SLB8_TETNG|nr:unnamed protein product [Tetraodon nigroviridis]